MLDYLPWMAALTQWERDEIELARYYVVYLRHKTEGHDRLVLLAKLAALLDRSTGFSGPSLGVGHAVTTPSARDSDS
jgi:hypothetical protein